MTLPWRPIVELPVAPSAGHFLLHRKASKLMPSLLVWWLDAWDDGDCNRMLSDNFVREHFTHFIEITPP